jgi:hypothetical protein
MNLDQKFSAETNEDKLLVQVLDAFWIHSGPVLANEVAHRSLVGSEEQLQMLNRTLGRGSHHESPERIANSRRTLTIIRPDRFRKAFRQWTLGMLT